MIRFFYCICFCVFCVSSLAATQDVETKAGRNSDRIDYLEKMLDEVERATLVDRLSLSADVRFTLNNYLYYENSEPDEVGSGLLRSDGKTLGAWNMRGRIKMTSMLGSRFKLTAWFTMYKQFLESAPGRYDSGDMQPTYDSSRGYYPGDSTVYMERLYADWFITDWLIFTIGRGSVVDGPPADIRYDNVRLGTFQESSFNLPIEGMYVTLNLDELLSWKRSYFRFFYVPRLFMGAPNIKNNLFVSIDKPLLSIFGIHGEFGLPFYSGSTVYFQLAYTPAMRQSAPTQDLDGDGVEEDLYGSTNFGRLLFANLTAVFPHVFNSSFDIFFAYNHTMAICPVRDENHPGSGFFGIPGETPADAQPLVSLLGNDLSGAVLHGHLWYGGFRYHTPVEFYSEAVKVGADINYATKHHYSFYVPDTTGLNRFATRGIHGEGYVILPVHRKANIRLAYIYQRRMYEFNLYHAVSDKPSNIPETDEVIHNWNVMLNIHF